MKLALIMTGGTIGSQKDSEGWISLNCEQPYQILELFRGKFPHIAKGIEFSCEMPFQILSENLNARYLNNLIEMVQEVLQQKGLEGILICHGTDTIQYTAAILSYVFSDIEIPILLVSSNYPLEDVRSNGLDNFRYAVETATKDMKGVYVIYRNSDSNTYVRTGVSLLGHRTFDDNLYSVNGGIVGYYDADGKWIADDSFEGIQYFQAEITKKEGREPKTAHSKLIDITRPIVWLREYPGMAYPELNGQTKAVILEGYHSGTIAVDPRLRAFAQGAKQLSVPIYLTGGASEKGGYETMKEYQELGIRNLVNQSPIAVYCRLWLELSSRRL